MAALLPLGHNPRVAEPLCALSLVRSELPTAVPGQHMAKEKCSSQRGVKNIDLIFFGFVFLQAAPSELVIIFLPSPPDLPQNTAGRWRSLKPT